MLCTAAVAADLLQTVPISETGFCLEAYTQYHFLVLNKNEGVMSGLAPSKV